MVEDMIINLSGERRCHFHFINSPFRVERRCGIKLVNSRRKIKHIKTYDSTRDENMFKTFRLKLVRKNHPSVFHVINI